MRSMSSDDAERRLRELEEQVRAEQASRTLKGDQRLARVREEPAVARTSRPEIQPQGGEAPKPGLLSGWPKKALIMAPLPSAR